VQELEVLCQKVTWHRKIGFIWFQEGSCTVILSEPLDDQIKQLFNLLCNLSSFWFLIGCWRCDTNTNIRYLITSTNIISTGNVIRYSGAVVGNMLDGSEPAFSDMSGMGREKKRVDDKYVL
jgi:hypothetical protein